MPLIDRREFIRWQTAGLAGAAMVPGVIAAGAPGPEARAASRGAPRGPRPTGFYRFELGDAEVTILSDGSFRLPAELFGAEHFRLAVNVEEDTRERFFHDRLVPPDDAPLQASPVLVSRGGHRT